MFNPSIVQVLDLSINTFQNVCDCEAFHCVGEAPVKSKKMTLHSNLLPEKFLRDYCNTDSALQKKNLVKSRKSSKDVALEADTSNLQTSAEGPFMTLDPKHALDQYGRIIAAPKVPRIEKIFL
jgi:hypothetical protein